MDLNTFNWKKVFSIALQIFCSAVFLLYFLLEIGLYFLCGFLSVYASENMAEPSRKMNYFYTIALVGYFSLIIANIIFAISFIAAFFLKYSRWLRIIIKYTLKFNTLFAFMAALGWVSLFIPDLFLEQGSSSNSNDWFDYSLIFVFCLYPILIFLQPCYFRYFVFYRTPIVRQRRLLWLNIVPSGILFVYLHFISLYIMAIINKTLR